MTAPGGGGDINLGTLWIPVVPETSKIGEAMRRAGEEGRREFEQAFTGGGGSSSMFANLSDQLGNQLSQQLKGNNMGLESNGYSMHITGPSGRERYTLRHKGRVVGRGDLRQAMAKGSGLERFERKTSTLMRAEARLRKFTFDSRLTQKET